jgi:hypothetical protein
MLLTSRTKGFFCVASPDVEETGCVDIIEVLFDRDFVLDMTSRALHFWKLNVFPKMMECRDVESRESNETACVIDLFAPRMY